MLYSISFKLNRPLLSFLNFYKSDPPFFSLSNLFKLDLSFDYKKMDKEPIDKFLRWGIQYCMNIKDFLPK